MKRTIMVCVLMAFVTSTAADSSVEKWIARVKKAKPDVALVMADYVDEMLDKCNVDVNSDMLEFALKNDRLLRSMVDFKTSKQEERYVRALMSIQCPIQA